MNHNVLGVWTRAGRRKAREEAWLTHDCVAIELKRAPLLESRAAKRKRGQAGSQAQGFMRCSSKTATIPQNRQYLCRMKNFCVQMSAGGKIISDLRKMTVFCKHALGFTGGQYPSASPYPKRPLSTTVLHLDSCNL
jgi:hypothetical protein